MDKVTQANPNALVLTKPATFFVPTDQAFNRLGNARLQRTLTDITYLTKVRI